MKFPLIKIVRTVPRNYSPIKINSPRDVFALFKEEVKKLDREFMWCLIMSPCNTLIGVNVVGMGTADSLVTHPREVLKPVLLANGSSFILVHNHPSGDLEPSTEDIGFTKLVKKAAELIQLEFLDHVIVSDRGYVSIFIKEGLDG